MHLQLKQVGSFIWEVIIGIRCSREMDADVLNEQNNDKIQIFQLSGENNSNKEENKQTKWDIK